MIAREALGFVYCVSSLGVTGIRNEITSDVDEMVRLVRAAADIPVSVGFGISTPEQAKQMAQKADGVIVGSAIVKLIGQHGRNAEPYVSAYVRSMKQAANSASQTAPT
jgi:tryptophan synthase alpha chain